MAKLDINPEGESQGIISAKTKVPKLKSPVKMGQVTGVAVYIVAIVVIVTFLIFALVQTQNARIRYYDNKISAQDSELANLADVETQADAIYGQVNNLQSLWAGRNFWSNVMKELSSTVTKNSKIEAVSLQEIGTIDLSGATSSLASLAKLMTSLEQNKSFSSVQLTEVGFENGTITFNLKFGFSPTLLGGTPPTPEETE